MMDDNRKSQIERQRQRVGTDKCLWNIEKEPTPEKTSKDEKGLVGTRMQKRTGGSRRKPVT